MTWIGEVDGASVDAVDDHEVILAPVGNAGQGKLRREEFEGHPDRDRAEADGARGFAQAAQRNAILARVTSISQP